MPTAQKQHRRPGRTRPMTPEPEVVQPSYRPSGRLAGRVALITGGDSGIGRSVAVLFAMEGADIALSYLNEHDDAQATRDMVLGHGRKCLLLPGDVGREGHCRGLVRQAVSRLGALNILVNNAAEQHPQKDVKDITAAQLERTFRTNLFAMFYLVQAALPHMRKGDTIINTASITAYRGSPALLDYSATKGAIVAFTRALAQNEKVLAQGVRVNGVAPGPIWTPLIPSTFPVAKVRKFGKDTPLKRPGQPSEVAPAYVFLASGQSSYITGQFIHPNGGEVVNT